MSVVVRKAMVLAAGLGTRMRPLTLTRPKPLIEVGGRALVDHMLDELAAADVGEAVVNVHYLAEQMRAHLAARARPHITISDETARLMETGGALVQAKHLLGTAPIFALNTDQVWLAERPPLPAMQAAFDPERMDALLLLARRERTMGFDGAGDFVMDDEGRLARRGAAESAPFVYAGVQIIVPSLFADAPCEPFSANKLWDVAIARGRLYGLVLDGLWMHVGDPAARDAAETRLAS